MNEDKYQAKDPTDAAAFAALAAQKDGAYRERNQVVAALAKMALNLGYDAWLGKHDANDSSWDPEWRTIVYIELPTGQVSWHLHDNDVSLFDFLKYDGVEPWDGHTTEQKYARLERYCARKGPDYPDG